MKGRCIIAERERHLASRGLGAPAIEIGGSIGRRVADDLGEERHGERWLSLLNAGCCLLGKEFVELLLFQA